MPIEIFVEKSNHTYSVDFDAMPDVSRNRVIVYGLTQLLSDATAPVATSASIDGRRVPLKGKDLASAQMRAKELSDARFDDLVKGIVRRARTGGDPVESEARRIAIGVVSKSDEYRVWLAKQGLKATDKAAIDELAARAEVKAKDEKVIAVAKRRVADMEELGETISVESEPSKKAA